MYVYACIRLNNTLGLIGMGNKKLHASNMIFNCRLPKELVFGLGIWLGQIMFWEKQHELNGQVGYLLADYIF